MKIYGLLNGFFYVFYGLYGVFMPKIMARDVMGWTPDLLGLHQIRAVWMAVIGMGVICVMCALKGNRAALTKAIMLITFCFMLGRILGLIFGNIAVNLLPANRAAHHEMMTAPTMITAIAIINHRPAKLAHGEKDHIIPEA